MIELMWLTLSLIYVVAFVLIYRGSRSSLEYGRGVSTMLGLFLPFTTTLETFLNIGILLTSWSYTKLLSLVLILCGTDYKEFTGRVTLAIITKDK